MEQLTVALPERAYDIVIERGLLQQVGQQCKEVLKPGCRVAVVTDGNVAIQYGSLVQASLTQALRPRSSWCRQGNAPKVRRCSPGSGRSCWASA